MSENYGLHVENKYGDILAGDDFFVGSVVQKYNIPKQSKVDIVLSGYVVGEVYFCIPEFFFRGFDGNLVVSFTALYTMDFSRQGVVTVDNSSTSDIGVVLIRGVPL